MLVSVEEFRRYLGGLELTPGLEQEVVSLLLGVQQHLETYLNRPVELVQVREVARSDGMGNLYLSVNPVRKLISYGVTVASRAMLDVQIEPYDIIADPMLGDDARVIDKAPLTTFNSRPFGMTVPLIHSSYLVEYIAGIDGKEHEDIKSAIKRVASREFVRNHIDTAGLRTGHLEDTEAGDTRNIGWTQGELVSLQRYRRRIVK